MRARIRLDKEHVVARWGSGRVDEWFPKLGIPSTVSFAVETIPQQFRYIVELDGPAEDLRPIITELMDAVHGVEIPPSIPYFEGYCTTCGNASLVRNTPHPFDGRLPMPGVPAGAVACTMDDCDALYQPIELPEEDHGEEPSAHR